MEYCTLDKDKKVNKEYKSQVCFGELQYHKNKHEIGFIQYKPKDIVSKPLTKEEKIRYLSKIKELPFFIHENKNAENIIKEGIIIPSILPATNIFAILCLVRYMEEKPYRVLTFLELLDDGLSISTALAFCHLLKLGKIPFIYGGNHDLLNASHFSHINCIKNYTKYLYENIKEGIPFNKEKDTMLFNLWNLFFSKHKTDNMDYASSTIHRWSTIEIMKYARSIDKSIPHNS